MSSSHARARYLKARTILAEAQAEEELALKAPEKSGSDELAIAKTGVIYARRELAAAEQRYVAATRERLRASDPEFARLERNARDASEAARAAHQLFRATRDVYHAAQAERPEGFRETRGVWNGLEDGAAAYSRITARIFRLHGEALAELKADLQVLVELATDAEGRMHAHLEEHALRFDRASDDEQVVA